jgi:hypothetical protein
MLSLNYFGLEGPLEIRKIPIFREKIPVLEKSWPGRNPRCNPRNQMSTRTCAFEYTLGTQPALS